ncbi:MAG: ArsR/SmtB family transcription factor [Candidatus Eiseniibacteriota bacterium]
MTPRPREVPEAARFFLALSDATRLALLEELRVGERTVGELVERLRCPQPKVSRHLKVLKDAGLVRDRRDGRKVHYELSTRSSWPDAAKGWIELLDAGLPVEALLAREARPPREPRAVARAAPVPQPELEDWLL